ncbi:hypothetical protein LTR62_006108 [Meristemomyces frigidus]|uniref:Nascent polypeptide-associated complex subunit alpha-like UBA domain-containing protein n=1 Tax=Meristemomyces frigidus TaxID=1508187 RepID=A0AAN7TK80_9PEZI|nr:hypothetical protein LTR62_006108 [Meristemomyces frigidus]
MAEPQPPTIHEGADPPNVLPANAEDRKAAAALSSLDTRATENETPKREVDLRALNDAMKNLSAAQDRTSTSAAGAKKEEAAKRPVVKVDQTHVALVAEQLDMSKIKATELLRAHDVDPVKAMTAWVTAAA